MKTKQSSFVFACGVALSTSVVACSSATTQEAEATGDARLAMTTNQPAHVQGTFSKDDTSIAFDIKRDGASETVSYTAIDGRKVFESTDSPAAYEMRVLGDALRISIDKHPVDPKTRTQVEGDPDAFARMRETPEYELATALPEALSKAGVRMV